VQTLAGAGDAAGLEQGIEGDQQVQIEVAEAHAVSGLLLIFDVIERSLRHLLIFGRHLVA
jgi:hypothetical protein